MKVVCEQLLYSIVWGRAGGRGLHSGFSTDTIAKGPTTQ